MVELAEINPDAAVPILPADKPIGDLEIVTLFKEAMLIGLVVSKQGRIFISYPRLVDLRQQPYSLSHLYIDAQPVLLDRNDV